MVDEVLAAAGCPATQLDCVAAIVGPGSFTGLRAALAVAQGVALAAPCPVVGLTVAEALSESLTLPAGRVLVMALTSHHGQVLVGHQDTVISVPLDGLPVIQCAVAVAGDAAIVVATRMAARGDDVMLTTVRLPDPAAIAGVAQRRLAGELPPLAVRPLYLDAPKAKLPAGGLRPLPLP